MKEAISFANRRLRTKLFFLKNWYRGLDGFGTDLPLKSRAFFDLNKSVQIASS